MELMSYCREKFEINNNYSAADMRIIAGLRYSIKTRYIDKLYLPDYVFVQGASMELITSLKENNVPGFEVTVSYTRQYHTNLAAHLLGYTGKMNADEYTTYKTQGYPMSATVGKDGAELAFEKYLHGTNGTAIVTKTHLAPSPARRTPKSRSRAIRSASRSTSICRRRPSSR